MAEPTQIFIIPVPTNKDLGNPTSAVGQQWQAILNGFRISPGYQRLYWGRQVETPENVQLHIVRDSMQSNLDFLSSPTYTDLKRTLDTVMVGSLVVRHAMVSEFSPSCKSLGRGAPVTGTAIYLSTDSNWDAAWANWVSIVQTIPGFMGIAGGPVLEIVDGHKNAYVALVGWENVEVHEAYHHTQHFRDRRRILLDPCKGYAYYGHIAFGNDGSIASNHKL